MSKKDIEKKVFELSNTLVERLGYTLVDVELAKDCGEFFLRIIIDKDTGITFSDCSKVSKEIKGILDEKLSDDSYDYFEVSSPGLDRILEKDRDFEIFKGRKVKITFPKGYIGDRFLEGNLEGLEDNNILINIDNEILKIDRKTIRNIKLNEI